MFAVTFRPRMGWIKWTGIALEFTGKLAQSASFDDWLVDQGKEIVEKIATEEGGYLGGLGAKTKAGKLVWSDLKTIATQSQEASSLIREFCAQYMGVFSDIVRGGWSELPHVDTYLCVVPRYLFRARGLVKARKEMGSSAELANLKGGPALRDYFLQELVAQLDSTFWEVSDSASPNKPMSFDGGWVVGIAKNYQWGKEMGHYYVYHDYFHTADDADKKKKKEGRKESAEKLEQTRVWLGKLSERERVDLTSKLPKS
jgi:hypothetical protein